MNYRLKHFLKKNALISEIGYWLREKRTRKKFLSYQSRKLDRKKIVFACSRYGDSLSVIAEFLHQKDPELKIVWAYRSGDERFLKEYPEYMTMVPFESSRYYEEMATSAVWVFNIVVPQGTCKRDGQLYIQVWHGDKPFKKIGNEAAKDNVNYQKQSKGRKFLEKELCDYFVTGSQLFIDIWRKSTGYEGKVLSTGLPRNDILLNHNNQKGNLVRQELKIPSDVKVMLYAPTHRDHSADVGVIGTDIDLSRVLDVLELKYKCHWICLKRSHGGRNLTLDGTGEDSRIIDLSQYRDITNLMLISDLLLTDYSSCAGDFAYTGRPVLLYQDDYKIYTAKDRSLIFDMNDTPFFTAHNMTELLTLIDEMTWENAKENDRRILELYQSTQTDHSTEDVGSIIMNHMERLPE